VGAWWWTDVPVVQGLGFQWYTLHCMYDLNTLAYRSPETIECVVARHVTQGGDVGKEMETLIEFNQSMGSTLVSWFQGLRAVECQHTMPFMFIACASCIIEQAVLLN